MKKIDFPNILVAVPQVVAPLIAVCLVAIAAVAVVSGVRPSVLLSRSGTVVGKVSDKWIGQRIWSVDSFANVATDDGGTVTVVIGDQFNYVQPGFRYEIEISEGRAVRSKRLPD